MAKVLYVSYDGMTDALGQSQVLAYLKRLAKDYRHTINLISFEKQDNYQKHGHEIKKICQTFNINWIPLKYHKTPPLLSTIYDLYKLNTVVKKLKNEFDIIHCRGYISALAGLKAKRKYNKKFIFDMRGFWADEKLESGHWQNILFSPVYKFFKKKEIDFFNASDCIISLTNAAKQEINTNYNINSNKIKIIPTCVDFDVFQPFNKDINQKIKKELDIPAESTVLIYSGSIGGNYDPSFLFNAFTQFISAYKDGHIIVLAKTIEGDFNIPAELKNKIHIKSVPYTRVHQYLKAADIGLVYYKDGYSLIGRNPTKMWEYLSQGVYTIVKGANTDIVDFFNKHPEFGTIINQNKDLNTVFNEILIPADRYAVRNLINDKYSLNFGINKYHEIYKDLS